MASFNISEAIKRYEKRKQEHKKVEHKQLRKADVLTADIKTELEGCKERAEKFDAIAEFLQKQDSNAGIFRLIPDHIMSYKNQSILQKILFERLILENKDPRYQKINAAAPSDSVTQRKCKDLIRCEKKLITLNADNLLKYFEDTIAFLDEHELELNKMKVKEIKQLMEHLWEKHEKDLVLELEHEFDLIQEKAILIDYLDGLTEEERKEHLRKYYVQKGQNSMRSAQKLFTRTA